MRLSCNFNRTPCLTRAKPRFPALLDSTGSLQVDAAMPPSLPMVVNLGEANATLSTEPPC